ncbi:MAG: hypothetical protein QM705_11860 [Ancrocorticia sp.]
MTPFFKRNRRRGDESETVQVSPASAPVASPVDEGTEIFGGAREPEPAPVEQSPVAVSPAESVDSESRPAARQLVAEAYEEWRASLSETALKSEPVLDLNDPTVINLSSPHPTGGAYLYAGIPTLLSSLIREEGSLRVARERLANLTRQVREMSESYGYVPVTLAIGEAWWTTLASPAADITTTASSTSPGSPSSPAGTSEDTQAAGTEASPGTAGDAVVVESSESSEPAPHSPVTRSEPVLLRTVRLTPSGEDDVLITLTAKCEVNPVVLRALRAGGVDASEIADLQEMASSPVFEQKTLARISDLGRFYLPDFGYEARVLLGSFIHPSQALLADLEAMKPYIESSGVMAALAGDEATKRLSAAPLPPASMTDRAPEAERGAGDRDVAELAVIEAVASGRSLAIDTPPGSEKVGTLAAIVADAAASGRSVLYIPRGASEGRSFIEQMHELGLDDLVLDFSDMEQVPMRLRTGLRLRHDEPEDEHVYQLRQRLAGTRRDLGEYVEALHRVDPEWNESVYSLLEQLAKLTAVDGGPSSRLRLSDQPLRNLRGSYDEVEEKLGELARLGAFSRSHANSAWAGTNIDTAEAGEEALARATRIAQETLPVAMAQSQRVAGECQLARATTLDEWIEQIRVLNGIAKTLDIFLPQVYERSVSDLVTATATREWREAQGIAMRSSERRRLSRQAREFVKPDVTVADLHGELVKVEALRVVWRRYSTEASWPELPEGMAQIKATAADVYREAESLERALVPGTDVSAMRLEELLALVKQLAAEKAAIAILPRCNALTAELTALGLAPLLEDFTKRAVTALEVHAELRLIYVNSVFEQLVVRTPTLANVGPADLKNMSDQLRILDKEHTATLVGPVRRAAVRVMRETISKRREETMEFDDHLARYGSGGLRDAVVNHSRLVQVARPVWTIPSMMTAEFVPPTPWVDLVIMDEMDAVGLPSAISLLMRGRQVVVMGDLRRASGKSAMAHLARVLPVCELPTLRAAHDESTLRSLREQGYVDVLPLVPVVGGVGDGGSGEAVVGDGVDGTDGDGGSGAVGDSAGEGVVGGADATVGNSAGVVGAAAGMTLAEAAERAPLIADLARRLQSAGWTAAAYFGYDDGVRIPLVVGSPRLPGTWRVAVLLDDETYMAEPSLRRRERYWLDRLEKRGWRVFQTFSTSLFIDPEGQAKEVISILEAAEAAELGGAAPGWDGEGGNVVSQSADTAEIPVIRDPKPRGPRPHLTPGLPLAAYTDDQLDEVMAWIISDDLPRSHDELVRCLREELDLHRRGAQVDAVLNNVVRRSVKLHASAEEEAGEEVSSPVSLLDVLDKSDVVSGAASGVVNATAHEAANGAAGGAVTETVDGAVNEAVNAVRGLANEVADGAVSGVLAEPPDSSDSSGGEGNKQ